MIRKSTISLNNSNTGKLEKLNSIILEYNRVVNYFIDKLWKENDFHSKFVKETDVENCFLSARMRQCASKQALSIIKSQSKKLKKSKPEFNKLCMELDSRFIDVDINPSTNRFDIWIKLSSIGDKIKLFLPGNKHIHFNKFDISCIKKSLRIRKTNKGFLQIFILKYQSPI